jgi:predicted DNA-binding protein with PD1-like motif
MQFKKTQNGIMLRLEKGEEIISSLSSCGEEQKISGGFVFGLGALKDATLGYFDAAKKEYVRNSFGEDMEFGSLTGSISYVEGKPFIHAHVVVSGPDSEAYFGHLFSATISATGEFLIIPSDARIERKADAETGLNLLDLS